MLELGGDRWYPARRPGQTLSPPWASVFSAGNGNPSYPTLRIFRGEGPEATESAGVGRTDPGVEGTFPALVLRPYGAGGGGKERPAALGTTASSARAGLSRLSGLGNVMVTLGFSDGKIEEGAVSRPAPAPSVT